MSDPAPNLPFFITGPTASGKSGVAIALAELTGGEIINADAFQLYQGLDILTAKPSASERRRVPHHLFDRLEPGESCDAQKYRDLATPVIADILARGRLPIVVGGSGLYIKALSHGLASLPAADDALRERLRSMSLDDKVRQLLELDPEAPGNVPLSNPRYVERALEICLLTGRPQSELRRTFEDSRPQGFGVVLTRDRDALHLQINQRVLDMVREGALAEVAALQGETGVARAIGVRELRVHLAGEIRLEEAVAAMQQATRRYAKRQGTWFRRETWLQTVCLDAFATPESAARHLIDLFPCLKPTPSPPIPSTLT